MAHIVRREAPQDAAGISQLTERAFSGQPYAAGDEAQVIERLRGCAELSLSLVTESDAEVIGQVTFSPATAEDGSGPWFALGPVSVEPQHQGRGIGAELIRAGLDDLHERGALGCILTGRPEYYRRFGFVVRPDLCPASEPGEYFMLKLLHGAEPAARFAFHAAFYGPV